MLRVHEENLKVKAFWVLSAVSILTTLLFSIVNYQHGQHIVAGTNLVLALILVINLIAFRYFRYLEVGAFVGLFALLIFVIISAENTGVRVLFWLFALPVAAYFLLRLFQATLFVVLALGVSIISTLFFDAFSVIDHITFIELFVAFGLISFVAFLNASTKERYTKELELASEDARLANEAKSTFLANMSHEMRTPLNAILGFTTLLRERQLDEKAQQQINIIHDSGKTLLGHINNIFNFVKLQEGSYTVVNAQFSPKLEIEQLIKQYEQKTRAKQLDLTYTLPAVECLIADKFIIITIFSNLLDNAIKFSHPKGTIELSVMMDQTMLIGVVKDSGVGINPSRIKDVFEPFKQVDGTLARQHGGTGLGLSTSLQMAKLLYGDLRVESKFGEGSTFTLTLPVKVCSSPLPTA
jgi:signal transduction histidine kinase